MKPKERWQERIAFEGNQTKKVNQHTQNWNNQFLHAERNTKEEI
jgi:hypothetical protein